MFRSSLSAISVASSPLKCAMRRTNLVPSFCGGLLIFSSQLCSSSSASGASNLPVPQFKQQQKQQQNFEKVLYQNSPEHKQHLYEKQALDKIMIEMRKIQDSFRKARHFANKNSKQKKGHHQQKQPHHQNMFHMRQKYSEQSMRLSPKHFRQLSLRELSFLLHLTSTLSPVNGASHVASGISSALPEKMTEAELHTATDCLVQLLNIVKHSAHNKSLAKQDHFKRNQLSREARLNTGFDLISDSSLVSVVDLVMKRLIQYFAEATEINRRKEKDEEILKKNTSTMKKEDEGESVTNKDDSNIKQKKSSAVTYYDDADFRRRVILQLVSKANDKRLEHLFREDYVKRLIELILTDAKAFNIQKHSSLERSSPSNSKTNNHQISALVAIVATSICRLRILNPVVIDFFKWAAPICISEVDLLSGNQLSYVLDAFSMVGYHHPALFVTLGEKAGELGELLREDEVARILIALDRTKIDHSKLRASLESSMRMRNLHRRAPTLGGLF